MALSKQAIEDLKRIHLQEFGEALSDEEAQEMGERLLSLFEIICPPIPQEDDNPDPEV